MEMNPDVKVKLYVGILCCTNILFLDNHCSCNRCYDWGGKCYRMGCLKEFKVSDFNKRLRITYSSTQYRSDLKLDLEWINSIASTLSDDTKILMYKRDYLSETIAYIIRDIMKDNPSVDEWDELFYKRFSDEDAVMNIDGRFRRKISH